MKGFVYILRDADGRFYIGSATDLDRRFKQHKYGHTQTTNRMEKPAPVLVQEYNTLEDARKVERKIKKLKRKDYIAKMVKDGFIKIPPL